MDEEKILRLDGLLDAGLHFQRGDAGSIPSAAQGLDQLHAGDEPLAIELRRETLIRKQRLLRSDHIEIAYKAARIAVRGDIEGFPSIRDRGGLGFFGLVQNGQARKAVFHFTKPLRTVPR